MPKVEYINRREEGALKEQNLIELLNEARDRIGHRRPHVRAAIDLAKLAVRDPFLKADPTSSFRATLLASKVLNHTARKLPAGIEHHARNAERSSSFERLG